MSLRIKSLIGAAVLIGVGLASAAGATGASADTWTGSHGHAVVADTWTGQGTHAAIPA